MIDDKFYKHMVRRAYKITKNWQDAEDIVQDAWIKQLSAKNVQSEKGAYGMTVFNSSLNTIRSNKRRWYWEADAALTADLMADKFPVEPDPFARQLLLEALQTLPKAQLEVMKHILADNERTDYEGHYETTKTNYRLGLIKLKDYFNNA